MVETITTHATSSISLEEFFDQCDQVPIQKEEDLNLFAPLLKQLANNDTCVSNYLCTYLKSLSAIEDKHSFLPPVFMPRVTENYIFRIVLWPTKQPDQIKNQLLYQYPHNHDVGFITCGYSGSGYATEIYHFEFERYKGLIGEKVELEFKERTTLPRGKIMRYIPGSDVHIQFAPETPSISLNIIRREKQKKYVECSFDMDNSVIAGHSIKTTPYDALFQSACLFGGEQCLDVIDTIARSHPFMRVRASAWQALYEAQPSHRNELLSTSMKDHHQYVRAFVNALASGD